MARITKQQELRRAIKVRLRFSSDKQLWRLLYRYRRWRGTGIVARLYPQKRTHGTTLAAYQIHMPA